ncbi:hypothetical protein BsWGS_29042 [Bradybaena similaris]
MALHWTLLASVLLIWAPTSCHAHGRMLKPCSRNSGYICGLGTPVNYNDHEMNCGGRVVQWDQNGGKCGICGDPWPGEHYYERPNGSMAQHNVISATYVENQVITIRLQITVPHRGYHEYRICNVDKTGGVEATQKCLDMTRLANENNETQFRQGTTEAGYFDYTVVLPENLTCNHCVLQWKWKCGNDWGCFPNGMCGLGYGERQEEFYACSDITITPRGFKPDATTQSTTTTTSTTPLPTTSTLLSTLSSSTMSSPPSSSPSTSTTTTASPTTTTPTTTIPSTATTTQSTTVAAIKEPNTNFQQNRINQFPGLRNASNDNSVKINAGDSNTNNGLITYKSPDDYINMIIGRSSSVSGKSASYPEPSQHSRETPEKRTNDRLCAMCASNCHVPYAHVMCRSNCSNVPLCTPTSING